MPPVSKTVITPSVASRTENLYVLHKAAVNWNDRASALKAVQEGGLLLSRAPPAVQGDREIVLAAIRHHGLALHYASRELRGDRAVVEAAVAETGLALQYAAPHLMADRELVLQAIAQNGAALEYAAPELREDASYVLQAIERSARAMACAGDVLMRDPEFVAEAVRRNPWALGYAPKRLQKDRGMVLDRWHAPPRPREPLPSLLPGLHATHLPRPQWQADSLRQRKGEKLMPLEGQSDSFEADPTSLSLPPELEEARQEACTKASITRRPEKSRVSDRNLAERADAVLRFTALPLELEQARQAACHQKAGSPRMIRSTLPTELELAKHPWARKAIA